MKKRDLLGYGAATVADSGPYNFVMVYFLLFMTSVAGVSPERSGTILSVIMLIDGLIRLIIGYISDNTRSKYGRRRPYLLASVVPLILGLTLLFSSFSLEGAAQMIFYICAGAVFWLGFGMYHTPYLALGSELTDDYNERSVLRTYARMFGIAANFMSMVLPLIIIKFLMKSGVSEGNAWLLIALGIALISGFSIMVTWRNTRGKEKPVNDKAEDKGARKLISDYISIFRLKPFRHMMVVVAAFIVANTFYNSSMVFFARYNLGIGDEITSAVFLVSIAANVVYTPLMGFGAVRFGKKKVMAVSLLVSGIGGVLFFIIGIGSYADLVVYVCIFSVAYTCFWQLINAIMYDINEVAEYKYGKRMEGSISSVYSFVFTVFSSAATQILGWILKFGFIDQAFMVLPGVFLIIAAAAQFLYPLDEKTFNHLKTAMEYKRNGETFESSDLKRII